MKDHGHPTDIAGFVYVVVTHINNSGNGEPSANRETIVCLRRFAKWCDRVDINDIADVRREDVESFLNLPTPKSGRPERPSWSTRRNRLGSVRRAFKIARQLGYSLADPTLDIRVLGHRNQPADICDLTEIAALRDGAPTAIYDAVLSALLALAESGATNGEMTGLTCADVDLLQRVVHLPGGARADARINPLTEWGVAALSERIRLAHDGLLLTNVFGGRCSDASISQMFAGLVDFAAIPKKRRISINSVRAWRALEIYGQSGRIEDAAMFLGSRSLDSTAEIIGLNWRRTT